MRLKKTVDVTKIPLSGLVGKTRGFINIQRSLYAECMKNFQTIAENSKRHERSHPVPFVCMYVCNLHAETKPDLSHTQRLACLRHLPYAGSHLLTTLSKMSKNWQDEFVT
jgi:hypothetical protein